MKGKRSGGDVSDEEIAQYLANKALEIAQYLANKALKKAMKAAKKLKSKTVGSSYSDSNPFGDPNLDEKFVWKKKIEHDVTQGAPLDMFSVNAEKKKMKERMAEIEKVKRRREERATEKAQHEEEMALAKAPSELQKRLRICTLKSISILIKVKFALKIRFREGRMKAIDILTNHINPSHGSDIEKEEPYMDLKGLTVKELEELHEDIKMYLEFDRETQTHI